MSTSPKDLLDPVDAPETPKPPVVKAEAPAVLTPDTLAGLKIARPSIKAPINMLIYGEPGIGKTRLAGSSIMVPEMCPVLLLDFEGGTLSLAGDYKAVEVWPDPEGEKRPTWKDVDTLYGTLYNKNPYKTIILDSLTEVQKFCYSADTEILTSAGWKLFANLTPEDLVAQYAMSTEEISFVLPSDRQILDHSGPMVGVANKSFDLLVTPNHRMLVRSQKGGQPSVRRADALVNMLNMPTSGFAPTMMDKSPSETQARLMVAWVADGQGHHEIHARGRQFIWGFNKVGKRDRLVKLLAEASTPFEVHTQESSKGATYQIIVEHVDGAWIEDYLPTRTWNASIISWSHEIRAALLGTRQ
jgi:hypothetical protein